MITIICIICEGKQLVMSDHSSGFSQSQVTKMQTKLRLKAIQMLSQKIHLHEMVLEDWWCLTPIRFWSLVKNSGLSGKGIYILASQIKEPLHFRLRTFPWQQIHIWHQNITSCLFHRCVLEQPNVALFTKFLLTILTWNTKNGQIYISLVLVHFSGSKSFHLWLLLTMFNRKNIYFQ